jgi:hypothetical protein
MSERVEQISITESVAGGAVSVTVGHNGIPTDVAMTDAVRAMAPAEIASVGQLEDWHRVLGAEGFILSAVAAEVLGSLGGLRVDPTVPGPYQHPVLFEPVLAGSGAHDIATEFETLFNQRFYPVAECISNACVFVGDGGKVVSNDDIEWLTIADSVSAALEVMLLSRGTPTVIQEN